MTLAAYALALSFVVTSAQGQTFAEGISLDGAVAIADGCNKEPIFAEVERCVALLVVMAARESGFRMKAIGDGGKARGPFQSHYLCAACLTWPQAVENIIPIYKRSFVLCPDEPLAVAASGSCGNRAGKAISRSRFAEVKRVFSIVER